MNKLSLLLINVLLKVTSLFSPKLTSRLAFKLFCTTVKPNTKSEKYQTMLNASDNLFSGATQHKIQYESGYVTAYEFKIDSNPKNNQAGTALLVHGWQSHSRHLYKFIQPLLDNGYRVIAVDLPGHGRSAGRTFHIPMAVAALHAVRNQLGEFDTVLSHSLGGAVVATALGGTIAKHPKLIAAKVVLISPPNSVKKIFDDFSVMVGLTAAARLSMEAIVEKLSGKRSDDFNVGNQLQSTQSRILVIHSPDDKEIPFPEAQAIAAANPTSVLMPMPGLGHRRIIASDEVVKSVVEFLEH